MLDTKAIRARAFSDLSNIRHRDARWRQRESRMVVAQNDRRQLLREVDARRTEVIVLCDEVDRLRGLLREAHAELGTIEAITVSPTPVDGLLALLARIDAALPPEGA